MYKSLFFSEIYRRILFTKDIQGPVSGAVEYTNSFYAVE